MRGLWEAGLAARTCCVFLVNLVPAVSLVRSVLVTALTPYLQTAPFASASLSECLLLFPHLRWCEGSRWLSWLEWVPARLVTTQILFLGWGAASAGWIQVILPLGDKSDLTVTSTAKGVCDVSEQSLNSAIFLLLFLFLLQRIQGPGLPCWFSGKDSALLMQVVRV